MKRHFPPSAALAFCALLCTQAGPAGAQETARHDLREGSPRTGTMIQRKTVINSPVPMDRSYAELTPAQQATLRGYYHQMPAADEPPFPRHGMKPLFEALYKVRDRADALRGPVGLLEMYATVNSDGKVVDVAVYATPDKAYSEAAATVLGLTEFKPAVCAGKPCRMEFPVVLRFESVP